ncbi:thioredoxin-like protein [Dothidotthia symphoricarpi CBS 119687]|uniref:Glutathione S-transferase kappa n=1 Tax=Dothidotthia symphoricarpi CBS 119687 TaxID=1392245 RepID=A0A6A6ASG4_9PLEO|nr:thioredoxin-like protein [Dothidotthia symphoricarpi CBS 119687]KAF2134153.1 thioredoxin-like protein [Dothidotthia symphoricarpi CBS 119687]
MSKPKITLYVDIVSPFAYIAFYVLRNSPVFKQCDITYTPIFLGGLMKACNNTPPLHIKNKDKWIESERVRLAQTFSVPITPKAPVGFPLNTLPIQRVLASLSLSHPESVTSAVALFYQNFWAHWAEPTKPENILATIEAVVGSKEDARKVVDRMKSEEVKAALTANTDKAFGEGAFGLPWFVATNTKGETQSFWGVDRLGQLCDHLDLERPGGKGWKAML